MKVNDQYRSKGSHDRTFVYFLQANIDVSSPYIEKWFHLTYEFNQDVGSARTLCEIKLPINRYTLFDEVTLDKSERRIQLPQPPLLNIEFCEHCVEKAFVMKRKEVSNATKEFCTSNEGFFNKK